MSLRHLSARQKVDSGCAVYHYPLDGASPAVEGAVGQLSRFAWHRVCRLSDALKVICLRCQQEQKPALLVTIEVPGDDRELPGLCWTHRLRLLGKSADVDQGPGPGAS